MSYAFARTDADLETALRRIALSELDGAIARLTAPGALEAGAVHDIRKRVKKLRALIRLVRSGFAAYAAENAALRDAGQALSGTRDAAVRLATFDSLATDAPAEMLRLRAPLQDAAAFATAPPPADLPGRFHDLRERAQDWSLNGRDSRILAEGLAVARGRAVLAMRKAARHPEVEVFHDWRKRAKDHWYHARLLTPIWPAVMKPVTMEADALGEALGNHHDLAVLYQHCATLPEASRDGLAALQERVSAAQATIEAQAFDLGHRLFAGDPDEMAALWLDWRKVWRRG